jgi:hypothetical protein
MTRERVEPGIWRRGEAFEITWRDARGKQRRKTVQGGCQVEVVDHERPVGTPDVVDVVEDQRAVRIGQIDDSLQEALVFEDLPVEVLALDRRGLSSISSCGPLRRICGSRAIPRLGQRRRP